jgi:tetratricopeptide (TPR) repeat protein
MKQFYTLSLIATFWCISTHAVPVTGSSNHYQQYMWATYNYHKGDAKTSHESFQSLLSSGPSLYAYIGYVPLLFALEQYAAIAALVPHLDDITHDHIETQLLFARSLELSGNPAAAHAKNIYLSTLFPHNTEVIYQVIRTYMLQEQFEKALACTENYLDHTLSPAHYLFYFLKAQIHTALNNLNDAETSAKKSIALNYRFEQSWLLLGLIYELSQQIDRAQAVYQEYLDTVGHSKIIMEHKRSSAKQRTHNNMSNPQQYIKSFVHMTPLSLNSFK